LANGSKGHLGNLSSQSAALAETAKFMITKKYALQTRKNTS